MADDTFDHAMITLLGYGTKSQPYRALRSILLTSVYDIAGLLEVDVKDLRADILDENGKVITSQQPLKTHQCTAILIMGNFVRFLIDNYGDGILDNETFIQTATKEVWINFRIRPAEAISYSTPLKGNQVSPNNNSNNRTVTPLNDDDILFQSFLKTGKRDKKDYDVLKDERYYDNWQRSFIAQARAHDIEQVLDPSYTPDNDREAKLFKRKQQFAYTVLDATLKTDMGKTIVRKHQYTGDAQRVWYEFTNYMKQSTRAKYSASKLLSWLTSTKYDKNWKGSASSFILYWVNQALQYDAFVTDPVNYLSDYQKQNFLQMLCSIHQN